MRTALVVALLTCLPSRAAAQAESDQTAVVAVVQRFVASVFGQRPPRAVGASSGTRVISPAVVATWMTSAEPTGAATQLDLLVLWRGTPGWFTRGGSSGSGRSSWTGGSGNAPGGARGPMVMSISEGGLSFQLQFDPNTRVAMIQDRKIPLLDDNVILVDDVDSAGGLTVAGTRRVDPNLPTALPAQLPSIFQQSTELFDYLRCDARVPDAQMQKWMASMCAQMREGPDGARPLRPPDR